MPGQAVIPLRPGLFGKLPTHGDFVARGLDPEAWGAWDNWASEGLAEARGALSDRFEAAHDQAPAWRFVLGPGRFGTGQRAGALAPSVDRVGRRYLIIALVEGEAVAAELAEACEAAIYAAFADGWDADALLAALPVEAQASSGGDPLGRWWTLGGAAHPPAEMIGVDPPGLLTRALAPGAEAFAA